MFQYKEFKGNQKRVRTDYDIALVRLDYPLADPDTGMTVLKDSTFDPKTVMPICLPPSDKFRDTDKTATSVGMGISKQR